VVLALLMGNLDALSQFAGRVQVALAGEVPPGFDYWASSRVIPQTINEFPYWTFLFADLHPHLIALPFGVLVVGLAANWVLMAGGREQGSGVRSQGSGVRDQESGDVGQGIIGCEEGIAEQAREIIEQGQGIIEQGQGIIEQGQGIIEQGQGIAAQGQGIIGQGQGIAAQAQGIIEQGQEIVAQGQGIIEQGQEIVEHQPEGIGQAEESREQKQSGGLWPRHRAPDSVRHPVTLSPRHLVTPSPRHLVTLSQYLLLALALGALGAINTWDLPTYCLLVAGALLIAGWRTGRAARLFGAAIAAGGVTVAAVGMYWPFYAHYQSQVGQGEGFVVARYLGWVRAASSLPAWLTVWGIFLLLSLGALVWLWRETRTAPARVSPKPRARPGARAMLGLALVAALLTLAALDRPTAALMALPAGLALPLVFRRRSPPADNFAALLLAVAAAVVAGTELIYLRDFLAGGDWYRMNTLFKFSVPAWLLFGLACGVLLPRVWGAGRPSVTALAVVWRAASAALILAGLMFLPLGTAARVKDRFPERQPPLGTLNGMDYMTVGALNWPDADHPIDLAYDYLAIRWLLDHVTGTPVIAETPAGNYTVAGESVTADYYRAGGLRVASFAGFPTLVGQHQYEQRPAEQVGPRTQLAQELFQTTDLTRTRELLAELRVSAVYVGPLERVLFSPDALRKFDVLVELGEMTIAYRSLQVVIYWVGAR
jgi:uncharacterized membrane protein